MKAILRNTDIHAVHNDKITRVINIPSEIWKDAGWEIGDDVELSVECGCEHDNAHILHYNNHDIKEIRIKKCIKDKEEDE